MSIALPTITLILIIAPGLLFRRSYYSEVFSQEYFKSSIADLLFSSIVPSIAIHTLLLWIINSRYLIDTEVLAILFSGTSDVLAIKNAFLKLYNLLPQILIYFVIASTLMYLSGWVLRKIVRGYKQPYRMHFKSTRHE